MCSIAPAQYSKRYPRKAAAVDDGSHTQAPETKTFRSAFLRIAAIVTTATNHLIWSAQLRSASVAKARSPLTKRESAELGREPGFLTRGCNLHFLNAGLRQFHRFAPSCLVSEAGQVASQRDAGLETAVDDAPTTIWSIGNSNAKSEDVP